MKLHSTMNNEEWKNLLDYLIEQGAITTYFAEKDNFGNFVYYKYAKIRRRSRLASQPEKQRRFLLLERI